MTNTPTISEVERAVSVDTETIIDEPTDLADELTDLADDSDGDAEVDIAAAAAARVGRGDRVSWPFALRASGSSLTRVLVYGVLPGLALVLALGAGYLKWLDGSTRQSQSAAVAAVRAATDSTVALLTYRPDTVDKELPAARDRTTGTFRDAYTELTNDVVIPGAKENNISAVATVPAAASVSATETHAVVMVFVNQTITVGNDPPTSTASTVRVTLDKIDGRWLISAFDPI